jgi:hypothetical protein
MTHLVESCGNPLPVHDGGEERLSVSAGGARDRGPGVLARALPQADVACAAPPASWRDLFASLPLAIGDQPAVIVLDEFPWATESDDTLEGVLQSAWDRQLELFTPRRAGSSAPLSGGVRHRPSTRLRRYRVPQELQARRVLDATGATEVGQCDVLVSRGTSR